MFKRSINVAGSSVNFASCVSNFLTFRLPLRGVQGAEGAFKAAKRRSRRLRRVQGAFGAFKRETGDASSFLTFRFER